MIAKRNPETTILGVLTLLVTAIVGILIWALITEPFQVLILVAVWVGICVFVLVASFIGPWVERLLDK